MKEIKKRKDHQVGKQWRCLPVCVGRVKIGLATVPRFGHQDLNRV